ncbi:uncharacterized protein LOC126981954 [Eriocheir sinensis]|uniref:uncharacterized protein LOC126981954 n=1 Tax=Eriocheir sinensis TaxID=95602 RepID=UPI0021C62D68|nr:uncharacterized protein LOC126981954 [Eriocheir sinensis]XP_050689639.1 uncharacterized protein LOC126981954 [Eriocheir sinensis]
MAAGWEGDSSLLVRVSGVVRFCCPSPVTSLLAPPPQQPPGDAVIPGGSRRSEDPSAGSGRYTILPTISVVPPWDDPVHHPYHHHHQSILDPAHHNHLHSLAYDQGLSDSNTVLRVIAPSPVLPPSLNTTSVSTSRPSWVEDAALNATHRFYNVLRAVLHGGEEQHPSLRGEARRGVEVSSEESPPLLSVDAAAPAALDPAIPPLIQVCAGLAVVVVVMVLLFHWHHIRHECLRERRALRRLARRYRDQRDDDDHDLEKNDTSDVTL